MFRNFVKIAFRNLWKQKIFSLINLIGLAIGMTACCLIYLYVSYELSYDSYHTKADQIYRLAVYDETAAENQYNNVPPAIGAALFRDYPEIESMVRINFYSLLLTRGQNKFLEDNVMFADSSLFSIFTFPLVEGDPSSALKLPYTVVLSETAARKYFGSTNPIGQQLEMDWAGYSKFTATITGVMHDIPANSQFRADIIVSMTTITQRIEPVVENCWSCPRGPTYFLVPAKHGSQELEGKFPTFLKRNKDKIASDGKEHTSLVLEPLKRIYLHGKYPSPVTGNIVNVYIFSTIALFILLIAGINFINLATARSAERAKEVGIRKAIGSSKAQLIIQFLGELLLLCVFAFILACLLSAILLPTLNKLSDEQISNGLIAHPIVILYLFIIILIFGSVAGIYPAFVLSSFKPASTLKGKLISGNTGITLRQILVVFQFTVSTGLIIGIIIVYLQMHLIRSQPLGFKKEQMLVIDFHRDSLVKEQMESIKQELVKLPNVSSASASSGVPNSGFVTEDYDIQSKSGDMVHDRIALYMVDNDFFEQYQIKVLAGKTFKKNYTTNYEKGLVLNEAALHKFGYTSPEQIIGKSFEGEGGGTVIGVVKNFNFRSLKTDIAPLLFRNSYLATRYITLSIKSTNVVSGIQAIEKRWNQLEPQRPFDYFFLDEAIDKQYKSETNFGKLFLYFGVLALFISSLGLFGLTLYSTSKRSKEIAIRKVVGASVTKIVNLLSKDYLKLVLVSFIIASPLSWYGMNQWLQGFAYRINISWWVFFVSGMIALLIALFTISFQSIKVAMRNPIKSLRAE